MMKVFSLLLLLCTLFAFSLGEDVVTLTTDNFDSWVSEQETSLVEFYAPWCGHCKHLAPEYEKAAGVLKTKSPAIPLAKVDATVESSLAERFGVRGYPTLKVFRKGTPSDYKGPREANGIVEYMEKQAGPAAKLLGTKDEITAFKQKAETVVIGFFESQNDALRTKFADTANALREEFFFGEINNKIIISESGHSNQIVLFRSTDQAELAYPNDGSNLVQWISANSIPVGGEYTQTSANRFKDANLPILKVIFAIDRDPRNSKHTQYYQRRLQKVHKEFEGKLLFTIADKAIYLSDASSFGLPDTSAETVLTIETPSDAKYVSTEKFSVEAVRKFASDFLAGKLSPHIKSEPEPVNDGPLVTVVGTTFDKLVLDPTKNVLIEFYAPWCGHCKSLAPKYEEAASKLKDNKDVVIAKIDATANDWSHKDTFAVSGYPTLFFKPAGADGVAKVKPYDGARETKDIVDFVKKNSVKNLKDEL